MAALIYEPFYDFERYLESLFNDGHPSGRFLRAAPQSTETTDGAVRAFKPRMDLHEDQGANSVTATFELPGFKKEDVQIDVHNGKLTVCAESKVSSEHEESGYAVRERKYGKYGRTLQLPQGVKDEEIKASMENGVLTVTFPKTSPEEARKKIAIA